MIAKQKAAQSYNDSEEDVHQYRQ
jgi:hypothetical protein